MNNKARGTFSSGIVFDPEELPDWLIEDMDRYNRTGEISQELLEYSAPYLNEEVKGPEGIEAFPGHLK